MTPEGRVKRMVKKALDTLGPDCWRFMPVQSGYGAPALDYLLAIRGRFVAIETKAPGKKLTPLQEGTKAAIETAGGIVLVVWDEGSLAIAMKIVLALEFAPNGTVHEVYSTAECLHAVRPHPAVSFGAFRHGSAEAEGQERKLGWSEQPAPSPDDAAGGDHGAPGTEPEGRA